MQERKNEREQIEGRLIVDRLEEGYAVCEQEDRSMVRIPTDRLPAGVREGDVLAAQGGRYRADQAAAQKRKDEIENKRRLLFGK